ncbi:TetR family transcriptional regulator [Streptomyces sp. NPDC007905]|uniref:TetR family transcriptional regulator n=1 Tax=Streptomyces sp. NPDC007905 TaxID=3364788 RepID=UPI0036ED113F
MVAKLDADGIEALSMRKLAARPNAGATSLYRHAATKDELIEPAVDEVATEIRVPPCHGPDRRAAVTEAAVSSRATALRHPWVSSVLGRPEPHHRGRCRDRGPRRVPRGRVQVRPRDRPRRTGPAAARPVL